MSELTPSLAQTSDEAAPERVAVFWRMWIEESYEDWFRRWTGGLDEGDPSHRASIAAERARPYVEKTIQLRPDPRKGNRNEAARFFQAVLDLAEANGWRVAEGEWMRWEDPRAVHVAPLLKYDCYWATLRRPKTSRERAL